MAGWGTCSASRAQDPRFLIGTDDPGPLLKQGGGLFIQPKHGASTRETRFRVLDMLPAMIAPRADLLGYQKAPNGTGRDRRQARSSSHVACQCCSTPMGQGNAMRSRQA